MSRGFAVASSLLLSSVALAAKPPPAVFVDKGACPFECCAYREWTVERDTDLLDRVEGTKKVGRAVKGTRVTGVTGEVHTVPRKLKDKKGRDIYLLTSMGEDFWKVWRNGRVEEGVDVVIRRSDIPDAVWWVQVRLKDGTLGWSREPDHFGEKDRCG